MEALVSRRVGCRATASDLVQELFLRFWRRPEVKVEALDTYLLPLRREPRHRPPAQRRQPRARSRSCAAAG
ncbi:ECF subfamily RNA polymerase sigma factor [Pseudomonas putida S11]|nr:ECF subfamily RNA polymerase sigma factor [Pseudomonas putida S11]